MPWMKAQFKDKTVWAEVDAGGKLKANGGRVPIRYSDKAGSKVYRASASGLNIRADATAVDLKAGVSADASPAKGKRGKSSGFGSAGTRTAGQTAAAAAHTRDALAVLKPGTVICFTDGGCKGNPGKAGSGVYIEFPDRRTAAASLSLGLGTNNIAELTAINVALDLLEEAAIEPEAEVVVFTDSKYSIGVLSMGWKAKANRDLILGLRERLKARSGTTLTWVAGHAGVHGNERADTLAGAGVLGQTKVVWTKAG